MMRALAALCVLFTALPAASQPLTTARYTLDIPPGWTSQTDGETWVAHPIDGANECAMAPAGPGVSLSDDISIDTVRAQMWQKAVAGRQILQGQPTEHSKDAQGRDWSTDAAVMEQNGVPYLLALNVVEIDGRAEGFLLVAATAALTKHQAAIDALIDSVRSTDKPLDVAAKNPLAGVWTTTTHELGVDVGGLANRAVVNELVLFADGDALWGVPTEGLLGFDRAEHKRRSPEAWGSYTKRGDRLVIARAGAEREYTVLDGDVLERRYTEGGKERTGERFLPRKSPNGTPLTGELRRKDHWPAPGNTSGIGTVAGCTFGADGTFADQRLMWVVLEQRPGESRGEYDARVAPGRGHYHIEQFTLVLEYDDGRVNRVRLIPTDDDAPMNGAIVGEYPVEPNPY